MKSRSTVCTLLFLAVSCGSGCWPKPSDTYKIVEGPVWSFEAFLASIEQFPYEMPAERRATVLGGYSSLAVGATKPQVLDLLGPPDGEWFHYNETRGGVLVESGWGYYFIRAEHRLARPGDQMVQVKFTPAGTLYWATGDTALGLPEIGAPHLLTANPRMQPTAPAPNHPAAPRGG